MRKISIFFVLAISLILPHALYPQIYLHGGLSGVLEDTLYYVTGGCLVGDNDILIIEAGATLVFQSHVWFDIYGCIQVLGTEQDTVKFLLGPGVDHWEGLFLLGAADSSFLKYAYIEGARADGIRCSNSSPLIIHCIIANNQECSGISCHNSNAIIEYCTIKDNISDWGGGIYCWDSNISITGCTIINNHADAYGGGIYIGDSRVQIRDCTILGNSANFGAGIYCQGYDSLCNVTVDHCLIADNTGGEDGGGLYFVTSIPTIQNCTISGNSAQTQGAGIWCRSTVPTIVNTIVEGSREGGAFLIQNSLYASLGYCDFYDNSDGDFYGDLPEGLGEIVSINANGDSCDSYQNIFLDPLFVNPDLGDFHLQSTSPCIDAGDPFSPLDPDSTIADIGAYYYHQTAGVDDRVSPIQPSEYFLFPNYPNPFNSSTLLSYNLPVASNVTLSVYNSLGRLVTTLVRRWQQPGLYEVSFDGMHMASGAYFYRLQAGNFCDIGKMILLK